MKNIRLEATGFAKNSKCTASLDSMIIKKIRGCSRNENCVYFNDTDYIVYKVVEDERFNKDQFVYDISCFTNRITEDQAADIYVFIEINDEAVKSDEIKPVSHYAKSDSENIALAVLREAGNCGISEFKSRAFNYATENGFSRNALREAIRYYA